MELELKHPYEAGIDTVMGAFFDKDQILARNEKLGSRNVRIVDLRRDDLTAKLVVERELAMKMNVPGIMASFNKDWNHIRQEEHWFRKDESEWHCEFRIRIKGVPVRMKGIMQLVGDDRQCTNYVTLDIFCDIPLLGKKLAVFLAEDSRAKIEREYKAIRSMI